MSNTAEVHADNAAARAGSLLGYNLACNSYQAFVGAPLSRSLFVVVTAERSFSAFIGFRSSGPPSADQSVFLSTRPPETLNLAPELTVAKDFKVLEQLHPMLLAASSTRYSSGAGFVPISFMPESGSSLG